MWLVFIRGGRNSSNAVSIVLVAVCLLQRSSVSFTRPNISQAFGVSSSSWDFAKRTRLESLLSNHCLLRGRLWYVDSSGGSFGWPSRLPSPYHRQSSGKLTFFWCFLECFSCRRLWWRMHCVRTTEKNHSWFLIWRILILTDWFALPNLIVDLSWPRYMPGLGTAKLSETSFAVLSAMSFLACSHHPSFPTNTWPWSFRVQLPGYWRVSLPYTKPALKAINSWFSLCPILPTASVGLGLAVAAYFSSVTRPLTRVALASLIWPKRWESQLESMRGLCWVWHGFWLHGGQETLWPLFATLLSQR